MAQPRAQILITAEDRASRVLRQMRQETGKLTSDFKRLAAQLGLGLSFAGVTRGIIGVALQTEKLRASLETVTGSAQAANAAFDRIKTFTAETPFQIAEVADAFIKLSAYGIEPTDALMRSLGNTASSMGKSLNQAVEALADATTGEFERLKEFGIRASSAGDRVAFTFRGVTTEVGKNADEIRAYLENIGNTDFAGAMDRQAATLDGAFSNLQDAVFNLADEFASQTGLTESIKSATHALTDIINKANEGAPVFAKLGQGVANIPRALLGVGGLLLDGADPVTPQGAREKRIEELNAAEQRLLNRLRNLRGKNNAERRAELQAEIQNIRELRDVLRDSLDDPAFQALTNRPPLPVIEIGGGRVGGDTPPTRTRTGQSDAEKEAEKFAQALRRLQDELDPVSAKTRDYLENVALLDRAWADGQISGERYDQLMAILATDIDAVRAAEVALAADRSKALDLIKDLDAGAVWRDQIVEVQRLRDLFPELADALAEVEFNLQESLGGTLDEVKEATTEIEDAWQELGATFTSAFEDAIVQGKSLSDVMKGLEQDIIRIVTRKLVTEPLGNIVTGFAQSLSGSLGLPGFAGGGSFMVGGSGGTDSKVVAFRASPGERVTVNRPGQSSVGRGVTIIQNIAVPEDTAHFRRSARQLADQAVREMRGQGAF